VARECGAHARSMTVTRSGHSRIVAWIGQVVVAEAMKPKAAR